MSFFIGHLKFWAVELNECASYGDFLSSDWISSCDKGVMVFPGMHSKTTELPDLTTGMENEKTLRQFPAYGAVNGNSTGDTCPTCRGTGRIPRGWFFFFSEEKNLFSRPSIFMILTSNFGGLNGSKSRPCCTIPQPQITISHPAT